MAVFCSFGQPDFVRWLISDGFVRQSKRALSEREHVSVLFFLLSQSWICTAGGQTCSSYPTRVAIQLLVGVLEELFAQTLRTILGGWIGVN